MPGKRQNDIDMVATKGDIIKDIIADTISKEIHHETGIACSKRENTEIRVNIIKLENLVKEFNLDNPYNEIPLFDDKEKRGKKVKDVTKLKTYKITREDIRKRKQVQYECTLRDRERRKKSSRR